MSALPFRRQERVNLSTAEVLIAEWSGTPVGFALFFPSYSTFLGKPGLYLEDLFVRPALRGKGIGKALLAHLAKRAVAEDCSRVEWSVLLQRTFGFDALRCPKCDARMRPTSNSPPYCRSSSFSAGA